MVAKLESDTPGGRTGWTGSGALGGRYAETETGAGAGAGAGVQTDAPGWCVACTWVWSIFDLGLFCLSHISDHKLTCFG